MIQAVFGAIRAVAQVATKAGGTAARGAGEAGQMAAKGAGEAGQVATKAASKSAEGASHAGAKGAASGPRGTNEPLPKGAKEQGHETPSDFGNHKPNIGEQIGRGLLDVVTCGASEMIFSAVGKGQNSESHPGQHSGGA